MPVRNRLPSIFPVSALPVLGVPFPDEDFEPLGLGDPQLLRDRLGVQPIARSVLPFIDTRAAHWHYYLFSAPPPGRGRPIAVARRLQKVLEQTQSRAGIGRRDYGHFISDRRRSERRFVSRLERAFTTAYSSATAAFWGYDQSEGDTQPPSAALCKSARRYVLVEDYRNFFVTQGAPDRLRHLFRARLVFLRRQLAEHIIASGYDLAIAALRAPKAKGLSASERLLFFSWAVLQAYFGIADDGQLDEPDDDVDDEDGRKADSGDDYFRTLADASIGLIDCLGNPGDLSNKQINLLRTRLKTALGHGGAYQPPVLVWRLTTDGRRRRVFASLRLFAFTRLLRATDPNGMG
jgi:hypothetical protein